MNDAGVLLLLFDGFDEMATRVDADTIETNLKR
jgi:predicted NACHT family NTPase